MNIKLEIMSGAQDGDEFKIRRPVNIGRDKTSDIPLMLDKYISRRHARLLPQNSSFVILEDLKSTNGTFYEGERVIGKIELENGDFFRLGRTWVQISW